MYSSLSSRVLGEGAWMDQLETLDIKSYCKGLWYLLGPVNDAKSIKITTYNLKLVNTLLYKVYGATAFQNNLRK